MNVQIGDAAGLSGKGDPAAVGRPGGLEDLVHGVERNLAPDAAGFGVDDREDGPGVPHRGDDELASVGMPRPG